MSQEKKTECDVNSYPGWFEEASQSLPVLWQNFECCQSILAVAMMRFTVQVFAATGMEMTGMEMKEWICKLSRMSILS